MSLARGGGALQAARMIASLMMYARPELEGAHARFWDHIRAGLGARGVEAPASLSQTAGEFSVWEDPALVLSQTCGMPFRTRLAGKVKLVGTPDYGLEGCPPGHYRSAIVVRTDDPRAALQEFAQARLAYNMAHSQSGFAALYTHMQPLGFWFTDRIASGGHLRSAAMVAAGEADIAALDAQTWRLIQRYESFALGLRVLEFTAPTPGLPYITGLRHDPDLVFDAVSEALDLLSAADRAALDLGGILRIGEADYLRVSNPPTGAAD